MTYTFDKTSSISCHYYSLGTLQMHNIDPFVETDLLRFFWKMRSCTQILNCAFAIGKLFADNKSRVRILILVNLSSKLG